METKPKTKPLTATEIKRHWEEFPKHIRELKDIDKSGYIYKSEYVYYKIKAIQNAFLLPLVSRAKKILSRPKK